MKSVQILILPSTRLAQYWVCHESKKIYHRKTVNLTFYALVNVFILLKSWLFHSSQNILQSLTESQKGQEIRPYNWTMKQNIISVHFMKTLGWDADYSTETASTHSNRMCDQLQQRMLSSTCSSTWKCPYFPCYGRRGFTVIRTVWLKMVKFVRNMLRIIRNVYSKLYNMCCG